MSHLFFKRLGLICSGILLFLQSTGQLYYNQRPEYLKANSIWALYSTGLSNATALDFNTSPGSVVSLGSTTGFANEGIASVCDPATGALLFYSDGGTCWNASHQVMLNGDSLYGNSGPPGNPFAGINSTTQGVCIVPFIDQPGKYYLFSLCGPTSWWYLPQPDTPYLYYSVIDLSLDGGLGGIVPGQKNIPLGGHIPLSESMIAIPGNNCDVWLMVHDYINPRFSAYHITRQGVDPNPVVSISGTQLQGNGGMGAYFSGGMAVTPDRKTIGISSCSFFGPLPGSSGVVLCQFDPATGIVGSSLQVGQVMTSYTLAFSPDNTKLYLSDMDPSFAFCSIMQYDISTFDSTSIATSEVMVGQNGSVTGYLKSYDEKIYFLPTFSVNTDSLFVIDQPNLSGTACSYQYYPCTNTSPGTLSFGGPSLPNDVVYAFPPDTLSIREDTVICIREGAFGGMDLVAPPGYNAYVWDDGSTDTVRSISAAGTYRVLCRDSCHSLIDSFVVQATAIPLSLGPDTTVCNRSSLELDATMPGNSQYLWQDGSTAAAFTASGSGNFWVQVTIGGCTVTDTIALVLLDLRQDLGDDIILCKGDALEAFTVQANAPPGSAIQWSTGSNAPSITVTDTGVYWVLVTDGSCAGTDTVRAASEVCECRFAVPTAFSPNGDGLNDEFIPVIETGCPVRSYTLNIYNRFGVRVYSGSQAGKGWNGYHNGILADVGAYMYEVIFTGGTKGIRYYRKGDLTLVR